MLESGKTEAVVARANKLYKMVRFIRAVGETTNGTVSVAKLTRTETSTKVSFGTD